MALQEIRTIWRVDKTEIQQAAQEMTEAAKAAGVSEASVNKLSRAYKQTGEQIIENSKSFDTLSAKITRLATREKELLTLRTQTNDPAKLKAYDKALGRIRARLASIADADKDRASAIDKLQAKQKLLNNLISQGGDPAKLSWYERKLEETNDELTKVAINARKADNELEKVGLAGSKQADVLKGALSAGLGFAGGQFLIDGISRISSATTKFFTDSIQEAEEFEKQIDSLAGILGISGNRLETLKSRIEGFEVGLGGFGESIRVGASDLTDSISTLASQAPELLKSEEALLGVQEKVLLLSKTDLKLDIAQATEATSSLINNFGLVDEADPSKTIDNVNTSVQQLAELSKLTSSRAPDTAKALNEIGGAAENMNVSLPETLSLIGALSKNSSLLGSRGGIGVRNFFAELEKGPDNTNPKVVGLQEALKNLEPQLEINGALSTRFGKENATAARLLIGSRQRIDELTNSLEKDGLNTAYKQAALNTRNAASASEQLKTSISSLQATLGSRFLGTLNSVRSGISGVINGLAGWIQTPIEDKLRAEQTELNTLASALSTTTEGEEDRTRIIAELNDKYPDFLANIDAEKASNEEILGALENVNNAYVQRIALVGLSDELKNSQTELAAVTVDLATKQTSARAILADLIKQYPELKKVQDDANDGTGNFAEQANAVADEIKRLGIEQSKTSATTSEFVSGTIVTSAGKFVGYAEGIQKANEAFDDQSSVVGQAKAKYDQLKETLDSLLGLQKRSSKQTGEGNEESKEQVRTLKVLNDELSKLKSEYTGTAKQQAAIIALQKEIASLEASIKIDTSDIKKTKTDLDALANEIRTIEIELKVNRAGGTDSFGGQDILEAEKIKEIEADKAFQALRIKSESDAAAILLQERAKFAEARAKITEGQTVESLTVQKNKEIENIKESNSFKTATIEDQKRIETAIETTYNTQIEALRKTITDKQIAAIRETTKTTEEEVNKRIELASRELTISETQQARRVELANRLETLSTEERKELLSSFTDEKRRLETESLISEGNFAEARKLIDDDVKDVKINNQIEYLRKVLEINKAVAEENKGIVIALKLADNAGILDEAGKKELEARTELQTKLNKTVVDGEKTLQDGITSQAEQGLSDRETLEKESIDRRIQTGNSAIDQIYNQTLEMSDAIGDIFEALQDGGEGLGGALAGAAQGALGVISGFYSLQADAFENAKKRELAAAGDNAIKRAEIEKKYAEKQKQIQKGQARIAAAQAILAIFQAPPILPAALDYALKIGLAAAVVGQTSKQVQAIDAAGFKDGVIDLKGPGTETSDSIPANLSRGESVMTAKQTRSHINLFSEIHKGRELKPVETIPGIGPVYAFDSPKVKQALNMPQIRQGYQNKALEKISTPLKRPDVLLSQPSKSTFVNNQSVDIDYKKLAKELAPSIGDQFRDAVNDPNGTLFELLREQQNSNVKILNK